MIRLGGVPLTHAVQMISSTPAKISRVDHKKGSPTIGKDADIVIFDEDIDIKSTIIGGRVVFNTL